MRSSVLILRSARVRWSCKGRTSVRASRRMRTATARALMLRDASQRDGSAEARVLASRCDAPQHEGERLSLPWRRDVARRTNLGLWEAIAGAVPLFPD